MRRFARRWPLSFSATAFVLILHAVAALNRYLNITQPGGRAASLVPWYVRAIEPATGGGSLVLMAGRDAWEAQESPEEVAQRLLDCQVPEEAPTS